MADIGTATVKLRLDWADVATELRSLADKIDPEPATVTPNLDDARQVETVATEMPCTQYCDTLHDGACTCRPEREGYARAVLAALAEAVGRG